MTTQLCTKLDRLWLSAPGTFLLPAVLLVALFMYAARPVTAACPPGVTVTNTSVGSGNGNCCYRLSISYNCSYIGPNPPPGICSVYVHGINPAPIKRTYLNHYQILDFVDYCIAPGTSRNIIVQAYDCNGNLASVHNFNVSCPGEECCEGMFINHVYTSLDRCCGEFIIQWNPEADCEVHEIVVTGAPQIFDTALHPPGYRVPYCATPGSPVVIRIEGYDWLGNLVCEDERTVGCPEFKQGTDMPDGEKSILSVFPNPAHEAANISFTLPHKTTVRLEMVDALGQSVAILDEGVREQGMHTISYATRELAAGMYQLKLSYGDVVVTQPLVVAR